MFTKWWYNEVKKGGVTMSQVKIGDYVTGYGSGYWQLIDIKPKIATEDYVGEGIRWKKGQIIGQWAILKKCFTDKMKPRIDFSYEDIAWVKPVSDDIRKEIEKCFQDNSKHKQKFDGAEIKLQPMITNCWLDLSEEQEPEFRATLQKLPAQYTMDEFWKVAKDYKKYVSNPPTKYLLNLLTYPWDMDKKANLVYSDWELTKN